MRIFTNILLVFGPRIKNLSENLLEDKKNYLLAPYTDFGFSIGGLNLQRSGKFSVTIFTLVNSFC